MSKIHDKFVIELAEVIKGYGNDPDVDDPFRLSEFYRFYELPEIAVSANHFKTMIPLEVVEKNAQPGWIPTSERLPDVMQWVLCQCRAGIMDVLRLTADGSWNKNYPHTEYMSGFVVAWMPLPASYIPGGDDKHEG